MKTTLNTLNVSVCGMKEYEELWKTVVVPRFQPMVIMDQLYEEFTTVEPYIANLNKMASFKDPNAEDKWEKAYSHQKCQCPI
jgi:hypothetical protein